MSILPNNFCNFHCSYCYAASSRDRAEIPRERLFCAIDTFFSLPERHDLSVSFLGGGEPLLSWEKVREAIAYIRQTSSTMPINVVTNGSIVTEEMIGFFAEKQVSLTVSFEVIPEIQDRQRERYDDVAANILKLLENGLPVKIRTILTDNNVGRMREMADLILTKFPKITSWVVEPVSAWDYFPTVREAMRFWLDYRRSIAFLEGYFAGRPIKWNSLLRRFFGCQSDCYCNGEFAVMPSGDVGLCHRVSSPLNPLYRNWLIGHFDRDRYVFDWAAAERFYRIPEAGAKRCANCPASGYCGGNCRVMMNQASEEYIRRMCFFIRRLHRSFLAAQCRQALRERIGTNWEEHLAVRHDPFFFPL